MTVHPCNRNRSGGVQGSEICPRCGEKKEPGLPVCRLDWRSIPKRLRVAFFESAPLNSRDRQQKLRACLLAIKRPIPRVRAQVSNHYDHTNRKAA